MLDFASEAIALLGDRTNEMVDGDRVIQLALTRLVELVGEAATRVPGEVRGHFPRVPWREATSTRNVLVHGYDIVRTDILCETIRLDFPPLADALAAALADVEGS